MTNHNYLIGVDGNLRFTRKGIRELQPYFAKAGIDIQNIKTLAAYLKAREIASPLFMEMLIKRSNKWPENNEFDMLRNVLLDHPDDQKPEKKTRLRIVK